MLPVKDPLPSSERTNTDVEREVSLTPEYAAIKDDEADMTLPSVANNVADLDSTNTLLEKIYSL
ncbi:MAG: hypothetical protein WAM14_03405 [Candidatus Nitrosopolaris sp.]